MLSGRLRRRALALLGALLLVILIWPPCCATMPKPLPAVLPTVPQIDLDPIPAVAIVIQQQQQNQQHQNKSRKVSDLSRFMNVLLMRPVDNDDDGESGPRAESTHDDSQRTLNLPRRENSSAGYPIESSIDKNKSNEQQTNAAAATKRLDNAVTTFGGSDPAVVESGSTYQPITNIFSILSQRTSAPSSGGVHLQVNDRGRGVVVPAIVAVNQSVFNPTSNFPTSMSSSPARRHPFFPVLSRAERSADGGQHHHHRHQHHYATGEGTLAAAPGRRLRHQSHHRNGTTPANGGPAGDAGGDSSNLERNERSANLSHITGANRKIQLYIKNRYLQLLADGTVNGTHDDQSEFNNRTTVDGTSHYLDLARRTPRIYRPLTPATRRMLRPRPGVNGKRCLYCSAFWRESG